MSNLWPEWSPLVLLCHWPQFSVYNHGVLWPHHVYDPGNCHLSYVVSKVKYDIVFSLIPTVCLLVLLCAQKCQTNCEGLLETTFCTEPSLGHNGTVSTVAFLHKSLKGEHILEMGMGRMGGWGGLLVRTYCSISAHRVGWDILGLIMTMEHSFICESVVSQHNLFSTSRMHTVLIPWGAEPSTGQVIHINVKKR